MILLVLLLLDVSGRSYLDGYYQSCKQSYTLDVDGSDVGSVVAFSELIYDHYEGKPVFELHIGPFSESENEMEFSLFWGVQDAHRGHTTSLNLLYPRTVPVANGRANKEWVVRGYKLTAVLAGGSRNDCSSWYITLTKPP